MRKFFGICNTGLNSSNIAKEFNLLGEQFHRLMPPFLHSEDVQDHTSRGYKSH